MRWSWGSWRRCPGLEDRVTAPRNQNNARLPGRRLPNREPTLPALICLGFILALLGALCFLRRTLPPSGYAGVVLFLVVVYVVVEIVAVQSLGTNANNTFRTVPREAPKGK